MIVAQALTDTHVDDATTAVDLSPVGDGDISSVTADAAYDTIAVYEAAGGRGAKVVVPPKRTAAVSHRRPRAVARGVQQRRGLKRSSRVTWGSVRASSDYRVGGRVTPPVTGSPEAVTRLRLPQNGACGFPALRSSQTDSQHSECLQLPMRET